MGVLIAAAPGTDPKPGLPLVVIARTAGGPRALIAVGTAVTLAVTETGRSWSWAAEPSGMTGELEVAHSLTRANVPTGLTSADQRHALRPWSSPCRVSGRLSAGKGELSVRGTGLVGPGPALADSLTPLTRSLGASLTGGLSVGLDASRPNRAGDHAGEEIVAWVRDTDESPAQPVAEALLSTTYAAAGQPRHTGLELWMDAEAEFPRRAAGEALAAAGARVGGLRWDVSFMSWTMEGRTGMGPYLIARHDGPGS